MQNKLTIPASPTQADLTNIEQLLQRVDALRAAGKNPRNPTSWARDEDYQKYIQLITPTPAKWRRRSPDAPIETNAAGGVQSDTGCLLLETPRALLHVGEVFAYGARKYTRGNWKLIPSEDHINHVLVHLMAHLAGDEQDDHLGHALCRLLMAMETTLTDPAE